jgi:hypothetical protein
VPQKAEKEYVMNGQLSFHFEDKDPDHVIHLEEGKYKEILEEIIKLPADKWIVINNVTKAEIKNALGKINLCRVIRHEGYFFTYKSINTKSKKEVWIKKSPRSEWPAKIREISKSKKSKK